MATYIIRNVDTKEFVAIAWAGSIAMLWDLVDTGVDPFMHEYAKLEKEEILFGEEPFKARETLDEKTVAGDVIVSIAAEKFLQTALMKFRGSLK